MDAMISRICGREALRAPPLESPDRLSFDDSIKRMADADEIRLPVD
jgi:hypothetical protein